MALLESRIAENVLLSLGITTFFRKSFSFQSQGMIVLLSLLGSICLRYREGPVLLVSLVMMEVARKFRSYDRQVGLLISFMKDLMNNLVMTAALIWLRSSKSELWLPVLALCPAQLIRRPSYLKDILRPLRVSLGPVSILISLSAAIRHLTVTSSLPLTILSIISSSIVFTSALLAGILFRPDNNAVLHLVSPLLEMMGVSLNYRDKVNYHAFFNSLVLITAMINVLVFGYVHK